MLAARPIAAGTLVVSGIYLYVNLFTGLSTPFLLGGDQALFWMNAQRLLHGELIYRDFLEFTPPGTDLVYLGAFRLLGSGIWVTNLVVLLLGVGLCWLCFDVARSVLKPAHAALATALFLVLDYGRMLNGTHHWFSGLAVMAALAVLVPAQTSARIVIAGALLGVATFFTQTRGPAAALGVGMYLLWYRWHTQQSWATCAKQLLLLFVPLLALWAALSCYFIASVGFRQLWYFQVTYLLRYVSHAPGDHDIPFLLVYCAVPLVYAVSWWNRSPDARRIVLLTLVGAAMYFEVAQSPNWIRLYCVAIPAVILFARLASTLGGYATNPMWAVLALLAAHQIWSRHHQLALLADLPAGTVATNAANAQKLVWLARHTTPGELLFEARWVDVYLPLALRQPVYTDMLEGGHDSRAEFVDRSIRQLETGRVRYIIWAPRLESPLYPFAKFRGFLQERYERVLTFPDQDQIWERK